MRGLMNSRAPISGLERPVARQPRDLGLLGGELAAGLDGALAGRLAGGQQLARGALGERLGAHRGEQLVRGAQLLARVEAAALAAQPFAVEQVRASELQRDAGAAEPLDRLAVERARRPRRRSAARASAPRCPSAQSVPLGVRALAQPLERVGGQRRASPLRTAASTSSTSAQAGTTARPGGARRAAPRPARVVVAAEPVVEHRGRVLGEGDRDPSPRCGRIR